jgi:hypothetical protein
MPNSSEGIYSLMHMEASPHIYERFMLNSLVSWMPTWDRTMRIYICELVLCLLALTNLLENRNCQVLVHMNIWRIFELPCCCWTMEALCLYILNYSHSLLVEKAWLELGSTVTFILSSWTPASNEIKHNIQTVVWRSVWHIYSLWFHNSDFLFWTTT